MAFTRLVVQVENWIEVSLYYISPLHSTPLLIKFRSGETLSVPRGYIFENLAETLLMNIYDIGQLPEGAVIVDVGASIGDFVMLASRSPARRVYAYEPSVDAFRYMKLNMARNRRDSVRLFNEPANSHTLDSLQNSFGESKINFLKVDCEGCEYKLLLGCTPTALSKVDRVAMEVHEIRGATKRDLVDGLKIAGFRVIEKKGLGHGRYLYASRKHFPPQASHQLPSFQ